MTIIMITERSIMKWTNILRCCEYCFVERLFGNAGRDKDTGTPMHAPFERNRLTMSVFSISTGFQAAWCVVALSVTIPLCLFFSPVVSIPLFVVPFASIFLVQEMLGPLSAWWTLQFKDGTLAAVQQDGLKLKDVPKRFQNDREIVLEAVRQNGEALEFASAERKNDQEMVLEAALQYGAGNKNDYWRPFFLRNSTWGDFGEKCVSEELQKDKAFVQALKMALREQREEERKEKKQQKEEAQNREKKNDQVEVAAIAYPPPLRLGETTFQLKVAATVLLFVAILCFRLIPFYEKGNGFTWWTEGASRFLSPFDLQLIRMTFAMSLNLTMLSLSEPQLDWQIKIGVLVVFVQLVLKAIKWVLRHGDTHLRMRAATPEPWELVCVRVQAACSWSFFSVAMDSSKAALEKTGEQLMLPAMKEVKEAASIPEKTKKLTVLAAYGLGTVTMVVPVYYALTEKDFRAKEFGEATGDNDILGFTSKEESMAFRRITIETNQIITYRSVLKLSRCRWLTHLDLQGCKNIKMDVGLFGVLLNLRALCCGDCSGLHGK